MIEDASRSAAELLRGRLAPDGLAYLRLGARARARFADAAGLRLGPAVLELDRMLLPVGSHSLRFAAATRIPSLHSRIVARFPASAALVGSAAPAAIARHAHARPLGEWLGRWVAGTTVVTQPKTAYAVGAEGLVAVAKVGSGLPSRQELSEADALVELAPIAGAAGADVPLPIRTLELGESPVLVETGVGGRVAAVALAARPTDIDALLDRLVDWLGRWNEKTAVESTLDAPTLAREVLDPASTIAAPANYREWLERRCGALEGRQTLLVASHNDLTSANVLVGRARRLGIVDWDTAARSNLPLGDFFYALADFQAASERFLDRSSAFLACFASEGAAAKRASKHERRLVEMLQLSPSVAEICFHACWLRHAANEAVRCGDPGLPFQQLVRLIAARRIRMSE